MTFGIRTKAYLVNDEKYRLSISLFFAAHQVLYLPFCNRAVSSCSSQHAMVLLPLTLR